MGLAAITGVTVKNPARSNVKINFTVMSIPSKVVVVLLVAGAAFSLWDYLQWRQAEQGKYGQGPAATPVAQPAQLVPPVRVNWAGVRWSPPQGWQMTTVSHDQSFLASLSGSVRVEVSKLTNSGVETDVLVQKFTGNLVDAAEAEVKNLPALSREREYLNTDHSHAVVLTWIAGSQTWQRVLFVAGERLIIIQSQASTSAWLTYEPTLRKIYQSVVLF